jgi:uncharacterized protein
MSTHAISRTSSPVRLRARPVMASLALLTVLFVVFAVDVLRLQTDSVPGLLASRVVGPLVILGFLRLIHVPLREIGLHRRRVGTAALVGGLPLVLLYALLYALHAGRLAATGDQPHLVIGVLDADNAVRGLSYTGLYLLVTLLNSFLEEGLFRGIMLPPLMRRMAFWQANAVQAALFGLWHLPLAIEGWVSGNATASDALGGGAELFVATSTAGLVFGYLYYRTGSLWAPWLAHTIDNLVLNVFHLRTADGVNAESDVALLVSLIGYPLLVVAAWAAATHSRIPRLQGWSIRPEPDAQPVESVPEGA